MCPLHTISVFDTSLTGIPAVFFSFSIWVAKISVLAGKWKNACFKDALLYKACAAWKFCFQNFHVIFPVKFSCILAEFGDPGNSFGYFLVPWSSTANPFGYQIWVQKISLGWTSRKISAPSGKQLKGARIKHLDLHMYGHPFVRRPTYDDRWKSH